MNIKFMIVMILIIQQGLYASNPADKNASTLTDAGKTTVAALAVDGPQTKEKVEKGAKTIDEQTTGQQPPARRFSGSLDESIGKVPRIPKGILKSVFASHVQVFGKYDWSHNTKTSPVLGTEIHE